MHTGSEYLVGDLKPHTSEHQVVSEKHPTVQTGTLARNASSMEDSVSLTPRMPPEMLFYITKFIEQPEDRAAFSLTAKDFHDAIKQSTYKISPIRNIADLKKAIERFPNLESLNLSQCKNLKAEDLDQVITLKNLQSLNLRGCEDLTTLPEGIANLTNLHTLNLGGCHGLTTLPEGIAKLTNLHTLNLAYCDGLTALPKGIGNLTNLRTLNLKWCVGLTALPEGIANLNNLRILNLMYCHNLINRDRVIETLAHHSPILDISA